jgi:hypothetical protein
MTTAHPPEAPRTPRRPKPPPVPRRRDPGADLPPPSASSTIPIRPEDIIGELER